MKAKRPKKTAEPASKNSATSKRKPAKSARSTKANKSSAPDCWNLRLYVAGQTPRSVTAFANLKRLCEERLAGRYLIEVIDLVKHPHLAQGDQIVAIPTLVRKLPEPVKRVVGDLSNVDRVIIGMELQEISGPAGAWKD